MRREAVRDHAHVVRVVERSRTWLRSLATMVGEKVSCARFASAAMPAGTGASGTSARAPYRAHGLALGGGAARGAALPAGVALARAPGRPWQAASPGEVICELLPSDRARSQMPPRSA